MKKFFHYLAAALLVGTSLAATSCSDDPEEQPTIPQFPQPLPEQTILPGESCNITIKPNMKWEVSIPEEARSWFYLDDNGTKVSKVHGEAVLEGGQPITIKVGAEDVEIFDAVDPVEVTMTMGTESKTIATLTIQHQDRELKFRMAKIEDGEYVYNEDGTSPQYSYEADANTTGSVKLEVHGGAFYGARLLVESNVSWTISVPDWIDARVGTEAATSGAAGQLEVELRANNNMPLAGADAICEFNATTSDGSSVKLAEIAVSLENLEGLLEYDLPDEALFSARGNYLPNAMTYGPSLNTFINAPEGVKIIALSKMNGGYEECNWVKAEIDPWSANDGPIQNRNASISVDPQAVNNGTVERQADIFVLPATVNITAVELVTEDWSAVREEYQQYLATTITQEAPKFVFNPQNSLAMEENGVKLELAPADESGECQMFDEELHMYCDWLHNDNALYYKLTYSNEWSSDGGAIDVIPATWCPSYTSYKIYGYYTGAPGDNFPADNQWIQLNEIRNPETNVVESFTVQMNFDKEYIDAQSKKYAIIVFFDETDKAIATLECTFDDGSGSGGEAGAVKFMYEEAAMEQGATLTLLTASDPDYQKYFVDYSSMNPSIYRLTYTQIEMLNMTMITGLPDDGQYCQPIDADWIEVNPGEGGTTISVKDGMGVNGAKGACFFMSSDGSNAVIIVVELKLQ